MIDGVSDGDKGLVWADNGVRKWEDYIYRNEKGTFKYLYNYNYQRDQMVVSEGGRFGFNKQSNIPQYHSGYLNPYNNGLNDLRVGGLYDRTYQSLYQIINEVKAMLIGLITKIRG